MEVAGLVFGVLSTLELCLKFTSEIETLVREYKSVESNFEWASQRLRFYKTDFDVWIQFWNIERDTPKKSFYVLWGRTGTDTIQAHLKGIKVMCEKASQSQAQYKRDFEASRSKLRKFRGKVRFSFSGRKELEGHLNGLRLEFDLVTREAERFFMARNRSVSISTVTKERIRGIIRESGMMDPDRALSVQQTSKELFYGLEVAQLRLNLDLALQPDYVSKRQFRDLQFDAQKLHEESVKLPVVVNNAFAREKSASKIAPPSVFVFEAGEKSSLDGSAEVKRNFDGATAPRPSQTKDFGTIAVSKANQSASGEDDTNPDESFILECPRTQQYSIYRFLVHSAGFVEAQTTRANSISLEKLFDNIPRRICQPPSRDFSITWQFDLAYTLALSVLNLQGSGWLDTLHSGNIYQRDTIPRSALQHSVKVCGNDILAPKETPLEMFFRPARNRSRLKPEIFRLGILMLEIGLARSVSSISKDNGMSNLTSETLDRLFGELEHSVGPIYAEAAWACLVGDFKFDYDMSIDSFIKSYISTVLEP